jgi:hypothetical protein
MGSAIYRQWGLTDEELLALPNYQTSPLLSELDKVSRTAPSGCAAPRSKYPTNCSTVSVSISTPVSWWSPPVETEVSALN